MNITYTKPRPPRKRKEPVRSEPVKIDIEPQDLYEFAQAIASAFPSDVQDDKERVA